MILLVDNYDSFTYNLAQYIGKFDEVQVLRNDDPDLYQVAKQMPWSFLQVQVGQRMRARWRDDPRFRGVKPILGFAWGIKHCRSFWRALGIGTTGP